MILLVLLLKILNIHMHEVCLNCLVDLHGLCYGETLMTKKKLS